MKKNEKDIKEIGITMGKNLGMSYLTHNIDNLEGCVMFVFENDNKKVASFVTFEEIMQF